jgi:UrcA family protein
MDIMNVQPRTAMKLAALAAALASGAMLASAAQAEGLRVKVGDLSSPAQAAAFSQRLDAAAQKLCRAYPEGIHHKALVQDCTQEVRDEAMRQLAPDQRAQLAAYSRTEMASAR